MVKNLNNSILRDGWEIVLLDDICTVGTGGTPSTKFPEYYGDEVRWLKSGDIKGGRISKYPNKISTKGLENSSAKIHPKNTVMMAMSGQGKTRGTCGISTEESACSQSVAAIICGSRILPNYLQKYLHSMYDRIRNWTGDKDRTGLNLKIIRSFQVILPPLDEQYRIAAILDKANEIKHAQNSAFNMRQKLINSTFESLFKTYFLNEDSFVELDELVESVRVGYVGPTSKHYRDQGVHYLRTGNVGHGSVIFDGMKYITQEFHDSQNKSKLKTGDIVISRVIGDEIKCSIIPPELDNSNCGNVVIVTPSSQMNSIFLCNLILSHHTQRKLMRRKVGSAQSVVNTKVMKKMLVPKIPIQLQEQFAVIVESISSLQDPRNLSQDHSDSLITEMFA